jgi:hypothetical protein
MFAGIKRVEEKTLNEKERSDQEAAAKIVRLRSLRLAKAAAKRLHRSIDRVHERHRPKMPVLDMGSSVSPTYGDYQEGTAYNGHFGCTYYHPLFVFNQFGDLER